MSQYAKESYVILSITMKVISKIPKPKLFLGILVKKGTENKSHDVI